MTRQCLETSQWTIRWDDDEPRVRRFNGKGDRYGEVWLEYRIDSDWVAAIRVSFEGRATPLEIRIFAASEGEHREPGRWSQERLKSRYPTPALGLPAAHLRRVPLHRLLESFPTPFDTSHIETPSQSRRRATRARAAMKYRPGRRIVVDDRHLAQYAQRYVELVESGERHPVQVLAKEKNFSPSTIKKKIREARNRGLLSYPDTPGTPGGQLTEKARRLLGESRGSA